MQWRRQSSTAPRSSRRRSCPGATFSIHYDYVLNRSVTIGLANIFDLALYAQPLFTYSPRLTVEIWLGPPAPVVGALMRRAVANLAALAAMLLSSCGEGLLGEISRKLGDPSLQAPVVSSFVTENRIVVSWSVDANADQYVLQRAADNASPIYSVIYFGGATRYDDVNCTDQGRYLYRLVETRGNMAFGPADAAMGVASSVCRDLLEPNDTESQATPLTSTLGANLFYYSSVAQQNAAPLVQQDADWYSVNVPPHRQANIVVTQDGLAGGSSNTWMYFYLKGSNPVQIVNNQAIAVTNYSDTTTGTFLFKIYPIPSSFAVNGGGSLITYTVSLNSITSF